MKKFAAILVLTILLAHFAGYAVYFMVRMGQIRHEMRRELSLLPLRELTRFEFTLKEYHEAKVDDHEIKVEGKMYDIARMDFSGDRVIIYGKHDEAEDNLLAFFNEVFSRSWKDTQSSPTSLTSFLTLTFIIEPCLALQVEPVDQNHNTRLQLNPHSISLALESPPPKR